MSGLGDSRGRADTHMAFKINDTLTTDKNSELNDGIARALMENIVDVVDLIERALWELADFTAQRFDLPEQVVVNWLSRLTFQPGYSVGSPGAAYYADSKLVYVNFAELLTSLRREWRNSLAIPDFLHYGGMASLLASTLAHELEHDIQDQLMDEAYAARSLYQNRPQEYAAEMAMTAVLIQRGFSDEEILSQYSGDFTPTQKRSILAQTKQILRENDGRLPLMSGSAWKLQVTSRRIL